MVQPNKMLSIVCRISTILLLLHFMMLLTFAQDVVDVRVAWSPDGSQIASGRSDGTVQIYNAVGESLFTLIGHTKIVNSVAWNPADKTQLASASADLTIKVWNTKDGALVTTLTGHGDNLVWVAWSPDGTQLISVGGIELHEVRVWDTATWQLESTLIIGSIAAASFSPDGSKLAIAALSGVVGIVEQSEGYNGPGLRLEGHTHMVVTVGWSPDGSKVVSGGYDQTIRLWDALTGQSLGVFTGHTDTVWQVAFSPDGNQIASASLDGSIRIWDSTTGENIHIIQADAPLTSVAWSPDGTKIAYAETNDTFQIVDVAAFSQAGEIPTVAPVPESTAIPPIRCPTRLPTHLQPP